MASGQLADGVEREMRHRQDLARPLQMEHLVTGERLLPAAGRNRGHKGAERHRPGIGGPQTVGPGICDGQQHDGLDGDHHQDGVEREPQREADRQRRHPCRQPGGRDGPCQAGGVQPAHQPGCAEKRPARDDQHRGEGHRHRRLRWQDQPAGAGGDGSRRDD
jgi:hypothetical protein